MLPVMTADQSDTLDVKGIADSGLRPGGQGDEPRNVGNIADPDGVGEVAALPDVRLRHGYCRVERCRGVAPGPRGQRIAQAHQREGFAALGGLPAAKSRCPVLAGDAVKAAVEDYLRRCKA